MASTYLSVERCELLVNGYVHIEYGEEVPAEIITLCLTFYFINCDVWDSKRKHEAIEIGAANSIKTISPHEGYAHIAGSILISKSTEVKIWKFLYVKYGEDTDRPFFMVSLISHRHDIASDTVPAFCVGYTFDAFYSKAKSNIHGHYTSQRMTQLIKEGEILTVKYETNDETNKGELYFGIEPLPLSKAFDGITIDNGEIYTIVVSFHNGANGETMQMLQ